MRREDSEQRDLTPRSGEPSLEMSFYGPRESFTGSLHNDEDTLRAGFGLGQLRFQGFRVGTQCPCRVSLVYSEEAAGTIPPKILTERISRLEIVRLAFLLTSILTTAAVLPFVSFVRKYDGKPIYEINRLLFGRIGGAVLNIVLLAYLSFLAIMAIRLFTEFIQLYQLGFTPPVVAACLIVLPTYYLTSQGL